MNHFPPSPEQKAAERQASQQRVLAEGQSNAEKSASATETTHGSSSGSKAASQPEQGSDKSVTGRHHKSKRSPAPHSNLQNAPSASVPALARKMDPHARGSGPKLVNAAAQSRPTDDETEEPSLSKVYDSEGNTDSSIEICDLPKAIPDSANVSPYYRKSEDFSPQSSSPESQSPKPVKIAPLKQAQAPSPSVPSKAAGLRPSRKRRWSESTDVHQSTEVEDRVAVGSETSQSKPLKRRRTSNFVPPRMPPLAKGNNFLDSKKLKQLLDSDR